jgi:hypothetical protein
MFGEQQGQNHITTAIGGRGVTPLSDEDRIEQEQVRDLLQAVAACYHTLVGRDSATSAALTARLAFYDGEFRRRLTMSDAERAEVLRSYPDLLAGLRAEIDR